MFNRKKEPVIEDEIELLYGYSCKNYELGADKVWIASYDYSNLDKIEVYTVDRGSDILGSVDIRFDPEAHACEVQEAFKGESGLVIAGCDPA